MSPVNLPSVDSLRCFCAAAKFLNFRAAARSVALTPAAFGQRIKQLEEQLGVRLFVRTTRSVQLSTEGLALLPTAERALGALMDCTRAAAAGVPPMELVVGTRYELGISWLLPQIDRLEETHPSLHFHLYFGAGSDLVHRVRMMMIDCAITSSRLGDPKLDAIRIHREDYVFVGAPALLDRTPLARPQDAAKHTLIDHDDDMPLFRYWQDAPAATPLQFARLARFGSIEAIRQRLLAGAGVGVVPKYLVTKDLAAKRLRPVFPKVLPQHDYFRLVIRADDARRAVFEALAASLSAAPLR
jgi:LysR family transcriptional regulator, glycine cleavage system transcriptional activator